MHVHIETLKTWAENYRRVQRVQRLTSNLPRDVTSEGGKEGKGAEQEKRSKEIQWDSVTSSPFPYFFSMNLSPINRFKYFCCLIRTQPSCTAWCCACCSCWWSPVAWRSAWVGSWPSPRRLASPTSPAPPQPTDSHETRRSRSWPGKCVVDVPKLWTYFW